MKNLDHHFNISYQLIIIKPKYRIFSVFYWKSGCRMLYINGMNTLALDMKVFRDEIS
jgi:hypothetical protein